MRKGTVLSVCTFAGVVLGAAVAIVLLFAGSETRAADAERGRLLYENHCTVCHTSVVHVRERRKAASREDIQTWIRRWQTELGLYWGTVEIDDVTEYLNDRYYRLKSDS
jgi:mono/diheme cytochrome c family protein